VLRASYTIAGKNWLKKLAENSWIAAAFGSRYPLIADGLSNGHGTYERAEN
jgi:hypothetical protein